jgi:hypothetical protein
MSVAVADKTTVASRVAVPIGVNMTGPATVVVTVPGRSGVVGVEVLAGVVCKGEKNVVAVGLPAGGVTNAVVEPVAVGV